MKQAVIISMLRAINLGSHNRIPMDALRKVYESLQLKDVRTYVQSGNVVFRTSERKLEKLARRIEDALEESFGCRTAVILRTTAEMREAIARNPFAGRAGIEPNKLLVTFLASAPAPDIREKVLAIPTAPEELRMEGRELYIYFPNGMARPKISVPQIERLLKIPGTGRNWNTVTKLLAIAEEME